MYYDLSKVLSYNAFLNFLIGERGVGKTYSSSKFVSKQFIKKGYEFVYVRRYKTELSKSIPQFYEALNKNIGLGIEPELEGHNLYTKGNKFYIDDHIAGYGLTLTTAQDFKSTNFSKVKYIIFDEFIIEEGQKHYLKNEVENFLGLIETIARMNDVVILMLGNAVTVTNPYFLYFDINLPYGNDIATYKDGLILVQYMKNEAYREAKKMSKFGKLVNGTEYSSYAIDNNFRLDNKNFIEKKTGTSKVAFNFKYKENVYGVWFDYNEGKIFVSNDYDPNGMMLSCTLEDHSPNTMLLSAAKNYNAFKQFIKNYQLGNVYFESVKIKNTTRELIKTIAKL